MQYLLLIYQNEAQQYAKMDPADYQKLLAEYSDLHPVHRPERQLQGRRRAPADLDCDHRSRSRRQDTATDGPFAETREQLGGYYLVEARDLDAAIAMAARIPGAQGRLDRSAGP